MKPMIRRGTMDDAETLIAFNLAMAWETEQLRLDAGVLAEGVRAALRDENKGLYFVAEIEGRVAGQLMVTHEWSDWRNADIWWVQSVYVHPEYRKRGLFKALFSFMEQEARANGVCLVRLYVHASNAAAKECYHALGMHGGHYEVMEKPLGHQSGE